MDALYEVLGAQGPESAERRAKIARYLQMFRQELSGVAFFSDVDLAPTLLAYAFMECRISNCQIRGLALLMARVYGRNFELRDTDAPQAEMPPPPPPGRGPAQVHPFRLVSESIQPLVIGKDRDQVVHALTAAALDTVGKWMEEEEPFTSSPPDAPSDPEVDTAALREEFRRVFALVLGDRGIH